MWLAAAMWLAVRAALDEAALDASDVRSWGHSPRTYGSGKFAVGVKTCQHYHETRLLAVIENWANKIEHRVFGTDAANPALARETVVVPDRRGHKPYIPPWAEQFEGSADDVNPWELPLLTKKLAEILKALHDRFIDKVDWFLVTDDDTFVRVRPLETFLSHIDPNEPHLIGGPVPTVPFLVEKDLKTFGPSYHCGGGSGIVLSKATLQRLRPHIDACLEGHHTLLHWYWDEVEFARCMYLRPDLRLNCKSPGGNTWGFGRFVGSMMALESLSGDEEANGGVGIGSEGLPLVRRDKRELRDRLDALTLEVAEHNARKMKQDQQQEQSERRKGQGSSREAKAETKASNGGGGGGGWSETVAGILDSMHGLFAAQDSAEEKEKGDWKGTEKGTEREGKEEMGGAKSSVEKEFEDTVEIEVAADSTSTSTSTSSIIGNSLDNSNSAVLKQVKSLQRLRLVEWGTRRFVGGLSKADDWVRYEKFLDVFVGGDWSEVGSLIYHTALPEKMAFLAQKFDADVDERWIKRFEKFDPDA